MTFTLAASTVVAGSAGSGSAITCSIFGDEISSTGADTFKVLYQGQLASSATALYTVGGTVSQIIKAITMTNVTGAPVTAALFIGGTAGTNKVVGLTLPANGNASYGADGWSIYDAAGVRQYVGSIGPTGARGLTWQGAYSAGTTYAVDDAVYYPTLGKSYRSLVAGNIGNTPPAGNNGFWYQLNEKGDQGIQGIQGLKGLNWQGAWNSGTTYALDDAVYYPTLGKSYRSLQAANLNHTPPAGNDAWWYQLNEKGDQGIQGIQGFKGAQWRGPYSGATAYVLDDMVSNQSSTWINILAGTGVAPPTLPTTSNSNWQLVAQVGATGLTGPIGTIATNAGSGLTGGASTSTVTLAVQVDGSTLEIATNTIQEKDGGTTNAKLANMVESGTGLLKGRAVGAGSGPPQDLTVAQGKTLLNLAGTNSGDVTLGAVGAAPNANAASLSTQALTLQPASTSFPGVMSAADKTKLDAITGTHTGTNTGDVSLTAAGAAPNANAATLTGQALTLQPANASFPGNMSAADFSKLAAITGTNTGNVTLGTVGAVPVAQGASLSGQVLTLQQAGLDGGSVYRPGLMSVLDKKLVDDLHYDVVADYGWLGNGSQDNGVGNGAVWASFNQIMNGDGNINWGSGIPTGARLFFPAGTYNTSVELTINVDKKITFCGVGRYASVIRTTSTTANIFHKSVAGWYDTFMDLGFQSTVTKTAGSAIHISAGNNVGMNAYRLWITGLFKGISAIGSQSANLSVWADLDISGIPNNGRGLHISGAVINLMIHNATINAGAATGSACCEINESGAIQVTGCDWIQGTNVLLINSNVGGGSAGPQACYFTNVFFDQPSGSVIKVMGANTANRIKFTQCGIAPTLNNHGVEFAGTGVGGVGGPTALPAGISIVDCDIYSANGTNTGAGIMLNGVGDVNIQNCRVSGFNGAGGAAVSCIPSAGNQTKLRVNGNIFGPNSNLTVLNATGVKITAGASALGFLSITDNSMIGCTTAIDDLSTVLNTATKNIKDNQGAANGLSAQATAGGTLATAATDTAIPGPLQVYLPPNSIKVGTTVTWSRTDTLSATSTTIEKAHIGTAGTVADATNISATSVASGAAGSVQTQGSLTFTSVGATAAFVGAIGFLQAAAGSGAPVATVTGTVNTTVGNFVTISTSNGTANTRTFRGGYLLVISPA